MRVPHSRAAAAAALFLAAGAHAGAALLSGQEETRQAGGHTALAASGSAFADLVQGTDVPVAAEPFPAAGIAANPAVPESLQPPKPQLQQPVVEPLTVSRPVLPAVQAMPPEPQSRPVEQAPQAARTRAEPVKEMPGRQARKPLPEPESGRRISQRGNNAEQNAAQGASAGRAEKSSGQSSVVDGTAKQQGNAAADNYRGQVLRRVMRAKRQRVNIRGSVLVRFSIAGSGALRSAEIVQSSGSAKLDNTALMQVRRAAPFPPPPAGARTSYTVRIKGK